MILEQDIKVKICGLTRPTDVEAAIFLGADYLGFIIEAKSPRRLDIHQARALTEPARGALPCVAVTVNPPKRLIKDIKKMSAFTHIQLHGSKVDANLIHWIKANTGLSVIRSIAMRDPSDISEIEETVSLADMILLDAPPPRGTRQEGGHGTVFDWTQVNWDKIQTLNARTQIGLAGGLTPKNIRQAKAYTGLSFFDVSSGVEHSAGVKEATKIKNFIRKARTLRAKG